VALRQAGNPHHAQEITQAVFVILAQKAAGLRQARALTSWLFQTTRLTAANFARSEARRHRREQEAFMQSKLDETGGEAWPAIAPLLDRAVAALSEPERQAILLRYYEDRNLREVGQALGASEDAAEKRVSRALEKLRKFLARRGVSFTTTIIAGTLTAHSVQAAPAGLAQAVTAVAAAKGAAAGTSTLTLVKGVLKIMAWTKMKTAVLVGTGLLLAGGAITLGLTQTAADEKPTAGEILRQVQTHYDALTTLRDSGTSVLQTAGRQQAATFQVKFARPHRYAMTLGQGGHTANMWNANGHEYGLVDQKMYFQFADDVQNLQGVRFVGRRIFLPCLWRSPDRRRRGRLHHQTRGRQEYRPTTG
jgi:RNA polymerase sigma factor (sigma-70 family)